MIVARTVAVRALLAEVNELQRAASEAEDLQETLDALSTVHDALQAVRQTHDRIADRLSLEENRRLTAMFVQLLEKVWASREDFEQRSRQAVKLRPVDSGATEFAHQLDGAWKTYAHERSFRYAELSALVESLPEMQTKVATLRTYRNRLRELAEHAPISDRELAEFDQKLQQFRLELDRIEGLTPAIVQFLRKVSYGTATLADLSDEVLTWCRSAGRANSFSLQLKGGR